MCDELDEDGCKPEIWADGPVVREAVRAIMAAHEFSRVGGNLHIAIGDYSVA